MHIGGGWANDVVRGDDPSAWGHGVAPVIDAPLATGFRLTGVVEAVVLFFDEVPLLKAPVTPAMRATMATTTTVTISVRRRECRRRSAAIACWRSCFPVFFRSRFCVAI